jgi:4a-hydroxytetrahydrobiopterin dehydratase
MATTLTESEARERLGSLAGWTLDKSSIRRQFTFSGFPEAVAFVVRLGFAAEMDDHHPDVLINYKRVILTYTTHSAGGLTEKDFAGAKQASAIGGAMGAT